MKSAYRTYVVGRSSFADIVIPDESVAPRHAEVVITGDGRYYLTDCASSEGTWRRIAWQAKSAGQRDIADKAGWELLRQDFVASDEMLRFGNHESSLEKLFAASPRQRTATEPAVGVDSDRSGTTTRPQGLVERDPLTGQIIRKRPL